MAHTEFPLGLTRAQPLVNSVFFSNEESALVPPVGYKFIIDRSGAYVITRAGEYLVTREL